MLEVEYMDIKFLKECKNNYDVRPYIDKLYDASKLLGKYECKLQDCKLHSMIIPLFQKREALSSMKIEGTQTTISDLLEYELESRCPRPWKRTAISMQAKENTKSLPYHGCNQCMRKGFGVWVYNFFIIPYLTIAWLWYIIITVEWTERVHEDAAPIQAWNHKENCLWIFV